MEAQTLERQAAEDAPLVRTATQSDFASVMDLCLACHHENGFVKANRQKMANDIWAGLTRERAIVGIIGGLNGKPAEACVVLRLSTIDYSDDDAFTDQFVYVAEPYRREKIGRAKLLLEFAMKVSDDTGIPLMMGILSNTRTAAKVRLYERVLGKPAGAFFLYNASTRIHLESEG